MEDHPVRARREERAGPADPATRAVRIVLLLLLALVPVVYWPGADAFEPHKAALLATGAAALLATCLSRWLARLEGEGGGTWIRQAAGLAASSVRGDPVGAAVVLFLLSAALSAAASPRPELGLFGASSRPAGLVTALATAAVFFGSRSLGASPGWLARIAVAASVAAAAAMAYAGIQLLGADPVGWVWTATFGGNTRVPGTLGHPNTLGAYLAMVLPLQMLLAREARSSVLRAAWLLLGLAALLLLSITLSRGAWIGIAGALLGSLLLAVRSRRAARAADPAAPDGRSRRGARAGVIAGLALALAVFLAPLLTPMGAGLSTRLRQVTDLHAPTTQSRIHLWRAGLRMLRDHPLLGVGTDSFGAGFARYGTPEFYALEWNSTPLKAHNELVQIAATQGALGLIAALLVVLLGARALVRVSRSADPGLRRGAIAAGASLAAWLASSLAGFTVVATGCLGAALAGWAAGAARAEGKAPGAPAAGRRPTALSWTAGLLLAAGLWIPLVLTPWRAERLASAGLALPIGRPARAADLEAAARIAPWEPRYPFELGCTRMRRAFVARDPARAWQELARARRAFDRALTLDIRSGEARAFQARTLAAQSALRPDLVPVREAWAAREAALAADSTGAGVLELLTQGAMQLGWSAAAHATALRSARLYPDFAPPMLDLGTLALDQGRFEDAADTLSLALRRRWREVPESEATARGALAYAWLRLGRNREALEEADRALRLDPGLTSARRVREAAAGRMEAEKP